VVDDLSSEVSMVAGSMSESVVEMSDALTRVIRTSVPEANRRSHERFEVSGDGKVIVDGHASAVSFVDLSEGGAQLAGFAEGVQPAPKGSLEFTGQNLTLNYALVGFHNRRAHVEFAISDAQRETLKGIIASMR